MNRTLKSLILASMFVGTISSSYATVNPEEFYNSTSRVQTTFEAEVKNKLGLKLLVDADLSDNTQNAYTTRFGNIQLVKLFGGLAQVHEFSGDEIVLIACHELGHSIGGDPLSSRNGTAYSIEGQSDYFASSKCFKEIFKNENNIDVIKSLDIPSVLAQKCSKRFTGDVNEVALCIRTGVASFKVAKWLSELSKENPPSLEKTDKTIASEINVGFPSIQCRLDTFIAGSLLDKRPACWFKE